LKGIRRKNLFSRQTGERCQREKTCHGRGKEREPSLNYKKKERGQNAKERHSYERTWERVYVERRDITGSGRKEMVLDKKTVGVSLREPSARIGDCLWSLFLGNGLKPCIYFN